MIDFAKVEENFKNRLPQKHPPVALGHTRISLQEVAIEAETDKALLLKFDGDHRAWCPKSQCKIRWGGARKDDDESVIDIVSWWYDKYMA